MPRMRLINSPVTVNLRLICVAEGGRFMRDRKTVASNGVNSLSMSARSELEPGPSWSGRQWVHRMGSQMTSGGTQVLARAVGWGGFTSG
jgi:hypothetical protein